MREPFVFGFFKAVYADIKTAVKWLKKQLNKK